MIERLIVMDMDGCLLNTVEPEEGIPMWMEFYKKEYPYQGWWSKPESLDLNVFDIKPFPSVFKQLRLEQSKPNTYALILTSRMEKLRPYVQAALDVNNINVNRLDMAKEHRTKGQRVLEYIKEFSDLKEIYAYDDQEKNIDSYRQIKPFIPENIIFNIFKATEGNLALVENENKLIEIINEEIKKFNNYLYKNK